MRGAIKSEESSFRKSGGAITEIQRIFAEWIVTDLVTVVLSVEDHQEFKKSTCFLLVLTLGLPWLQQTKA